MVPEADVYRQALDAFPNPVSIASAVRGEDGEIIDFSIVYVNALAASLVGLTPEEVAGERMVEKLPAVRASGLFEEYCKVVSDRTTFSTGPFPFEGVWASRRRVAGVFEIQVAPLGDGFVSTAIDVSDREESQRMLTEAKETLSRKESLEREAREINDRLIDALVQASRSLDKGDVARGKRSLQDALDHASRIVTELKEWLPKIETRKIHKR